MTGTERRRSRVQPGLSWEIAVGAVALEKIRQRETPTTEEVQTLRGVADRLSALAEAQALPVRVLLEGETRLGRRLRDSFATLVSLQRSQVAAPGVERLRTAGEKLVLICQRLELKIDPSEPIEAADIALAQDACLELLENLERAQVLGAEQS